MSVLRDSEGSEAGQVIRSLWYHTKEHGGLTEQRRQEGHREGVNPQNPGELGVLVPDAPTVRVTFANIQEARLQTHIDPGLGPIRH